MVRLFAVLDVIVVACDVVVADDVRRVDTVRPVVVAVLQVQVSK